MKANYCGVGESVLQEPLTRELHPYGARRKQSESRALDGERVNRDRALSNDVTDCRGVPGHPIIARHREMSPGSRKERRGVSRS